MWKTRRNHKNPLSAALDSPLSSVQCHPRATGVCSGLPDPEMSSFPFPAALCPFCAVSCAQPLAGPTQRPLFAELPRPPSSLERACLCFSYAGLISHLHPPQARWSRLPPSLPGPSCLLVHLRPAGRGLAWDLLLSSRSSLPAQVAPLPCGFGPAILPRDLLHAGDLRSAPAISADLRRQHPPLLAAPLSEDDGAGNCSALFRVTRGKAR